MISPEDVEKIAHLADIGLPEERLGEFTKEFNAILEYFDVLDTVREEVLALTKEPEDGFIRAPRVME